LGSEGVSQPDKNRMLRLAAFAGSASTVQWLIDASADPNTEECGGDSDCTEGLSPLMLAAEAQAPIVAALISAKAHVNATGTNGETALMRGVMNPECGSIFKLLVGAKAQLEAADSHGQRCLELAARRGMHLASQVLLTLKAEVNCKDKFGDTALMRACESEQLDIVSLLLEHGADPHIENCYGVDSKQRAYDTHNQELLHLVMGKEYSDLCTALGSMEFKREPQIAILEIDVDADGEVDYAVSGIDRDEDGIPDGVQGLVSSLGFSVRDGVASSEAGHSLRKAKGVSFR